MMQSLRSGAQSTAARVLVLLIVLSFAGFGLESVLFGGSGTSVADVNGVEITPQELQIAVENQKRQLMQIFGDSVDPAMLDDDRISPRALEGLIERTLLLQQAEAKALAASSRTIGELVASIEAFMVGGQFDPDQYKVVLANAGYTPERFRREQAQQIMLNQLQVAVSASDFTTARELELAAVVGAEERDVRYLLVPSEAIQGSIAVTAEDVSSFYQSNLQRYTTEEEVVADYILLSREDFIQPVDQEVVDAQFDDVAADYEVSEQTSVAHILLVQRDNESAEEYATRIDDVAARLASGEEFSVIAGETSDDIGSASTGGQLGFTDGSVFPEPMEAAIAELGIGEISSPVETDAGVHFIRVEERVATDAPDYTALRAELELAIQQSEAEQVLLATVESLREMVFSAGDLKQPADALGLLVQSASGISRSAGSGVFDDAAARDALFEEEVYELGNNSTVLELSGNRFLVTRINQKLPSRRLSLNEVEDDIRVELETTATDEAYQNLVGEVRRRVSAGETLEEIANTDGYEWRVELGARRSGGLLPPEVVRLAFDMQTAGPATIDKVELPGGDVAIVELARVTPGNVASLVPGEADQLVSQLGEVQGQLSLLEYRMALRQNADIVIR
jgi:peptidyl-prolyl cis-trans isomerase D